MVYAYQFSNFNSKMLLTLHVRLAWSLICAFLPTSWNRGCMRTQLQPCRLPPCCAPRLPSVTPAACHPSVISTSLTITIMSDHHVVGAYNTAIGQ